MTTKKHIPLFRSLLTAAALLIMAGCSLALESTTGEIPVITGESQPKTDARLDEMTGVLEEVLANHPEVVVFQLYDLTVDRADFSEDSNLALLWLAMHDKESGMVVPTEPFLAIAYRDVEEDGSPSVWEIAFPVDANWNELLSSVPESLLAEETRQHYLDRTQSTQKGPALQGYYLPWQAGLKKYLTGSVGHVLTYRSCPDTCLYSFDYADGSMFPILASRAGRVKQAVWMWPNGDPERANFLLLQDDTTNPVTYQIYFHLAQDSIPPEFRQVGAQVFQGQQIGLADDTGFSTGHHLHFQVHTNASSYWGTSVDIIYKDVTVNGGRPRTCSEASTYPGYGSQCLSANLFTSANSDSEPPTSAITSPANGSEVSTSTITVEGWASDINEVMYTQLLIGTGSDWKAIGDLQKGTSYTQEIDLCQAGIPDGNFFLAIQAIDQAGNLSASDKGVIYLVNRSTCDGEPGGAQLEAPDAENSGNLNLDGAPVSQSIKTRLKELEPVYQETTIPLEWEVVDGEDQIAYFLLQVQQDESSWEDWSEILSSDIRAIPFVGETGSNYSFRLLAVDNQDSPEEVTADNETSTRIGPLCDADAYDQNSSGDNQPGSATLLPFGETQQHNLCGAGDEDWYKFSATAGSTYRVTANPSLGETALQMELYNADGSTLVSSSQGITAGSRVDITWTAPESLDYTVRILGDNPGGQGSEAEYEISVRRTFQLSNSYLCDVTIPLLEARLGLKLDALRARVCE